MLMLILAHNSSCNNTPAACLSCLSHFVWRHFYPSHTIGHFITHPAQELRAYSSTVFTRIKSSPSLRPNTLAWPVSQSKEVLKVGFCMHTLPSTACIGLASERASSAALNSADIVISCEATKDLAGRQSFTVRHDHYRCPH